MELELRVSQSLEAVSGSSQKQVSCAATWLFLNGHLSSSDAPTLSYLHASNGSCKYDRHTWGIMRTLQSSRDLWHVCLQSAFRRTSRTNAVSPLGRQTEAV